MMFFLQYLIYLLLFCSFSESWFIVRGKQEYIRSQNGFRFKRKGNTLYDSSSRNIPSLKIEPASNADFDKIATFLAYYLYTDDIPPAQRRELARLQLNDINKRYAERIGTRQFPAVLLKGTVNGELVGVVGLDCHYLDVLNKRLVDIERALDGKPSNIVPVIGNLAIAEKYRRFGYGRQLVRSCELFAQEWGFQGLYLLVAADNVAAQQLYKKCGFKVIYTDENAVAVTSTPNGLRTLQCTKLCLGKSFEPERSSSSETSFFSSISSAFKGIFQKN